MNEDSLKDFGDNIELTSDLHFREVPGGGERERCAKIFSRKNGEGKRHTDWGYLVWNSPGFPKRHTPRQINLLF